MKPTRCGRKPVVGWVGERRILIVLTCWHACQRGTGGVLANHPALIPWCKGTQSASRSLLGVCGVTLSNSAVHRWADWMYWMECWCPAPCAHSRKGCASQNGCDAENTGERVDARYELEHAMLQRRSCRLLSQSSRRLARWFKSHWRSSWVHPMAGCIGTQRNGAHGSRRYFVNALEGEPCSSRGSGSGAAQRTPM